MKDKITVGTTERNVYAFHLAAGTHLDQAEIAWSSHMRARNWTATVVFDPAQPGGLRREFWTRGSGSYVSVPPALAAGDFLEVASDYYTCGGNKQADRHYLRVLARQPESLVCREAGKPGEHPRDVADEIKAVDLASADPAAMPTPVTVTPGPLAEYTTDELLAELVRRGVRVTE